MTELFLGIIIGYVIGGITFFILEAFCIVAGKSDKEKWIEEEDDESN